MNIDTTRLMASRPPKFYNNCKVSDLDPLSKSTVPREIEIILPDDDGSKVLAMWHGERALAVDDYVRLRRDTTDSIYVVVGYGGGSGTEIDAVKVSKLWESDGGAAAVTVDADGNVGIGTASPDAILTIEDATARINMKDTDGVNDIGFYKTGEAVFATIRAENTGVGAGELQLWTDDGSTHGQRMTIDEDGNVGVGTTSPGELLEVEDGNIATNQSSEATWFDYLLIGDNATDGVTSHFRDNDSSYPAGWTESDAASTVNTNNVYSQWYLVGTSVDTSWDYRIKSNQDVEAGGTRTRVMFGPLFWRQFSFTADVNYYLGIYRNNAGAIDTATYARVRIRYDQAAGLWKIRGEESDGSTSHTGTEYSLDAQPIHFPLYVLIGIISASGIIEIDYGVFPIINTGLRIMTQTPTVQPTWGDAWVRLNMSRGAGASDILWVGAVDFVGT